MVCNVSEIHCTLFQQVRGKASFVPRDMQRNMNMKINNTTSIFKQFIAMEIGPFLGHRNMSGFIESHSLGVTARILNIDVFSVYPRNPMRSYLKNSFLLWIIFLGSLHLLFPQGCNHFLVAVVKKHWINNQLEKPCIRAEEGVCMYISMYSRHVK